MITIKIKRGLAANRLSITPISGELVYTIDDKKIYVGDGSTAGGTAVNESASEMLIKLLTVDGTGSNIDGDLIGGLNSTQIVRSDQDGFFDGELTVNDTIYELINSTLTSNAITDVFIYDTSNDYDGGQWRKRTQNTSWYNETLNTATRGKTKEFPAVAIIVTEADTVTIYDATSHDIPMWMVFNSSVSFQDTALGRISLIRNTGIALNGMVIIGGRSASNYSDAMFVITFISDSMKYYNTVNPNTYINQTIVGRNQAINFSGFNPNVLVASVINDISMTVLPNPPIDTTTGLPIPTIAVATDSGVSVIKSDGTIVDYTYASEPVVRTVKFTKDNRIMFAWDNDRILSIFDLHTNDFAITHAITGNSGTEKLRMGGANAANLGFRPALHGQSTTAKVLSDYKTQETNDYLAISASTATNDTALTLVRDDAPESSVSNSNISTKDIMVNYINNEYQTGWMAGGIDGAFLSSTDTSDLVGGTDNDRSINNNALTVSGTVNRSPVATGAELVSYSGFTTANYLEQPYNSDLDFGTGDFCFYGWVKLTDTSIDQRILGRSDSVTTKRISLYFINETLYLYTADNTTISFVALLNTTIENRYIFIVASRQDGILNLSIDTNSDGLSTSDTGSKDLTTLTNQPYYIGGQIFPGFNGGVTDLPLLNGSLALWRVSKTIPSTDQIKYIYESERHLFEENAKCILTSSTPTIMSLEHDPVTDNLLIGGTDNIDTFNGLVRVDSEAGIYTSLSANNNLIAKGN